jgi:hypothetical protein
MKKGVTSAFFLTCGCAMAVANSGGTVSIFTVNQNPETFVGQQVTLQGWASHQFGQTGFWTLPGDQAHTWGPQRAQTCIGLRGEPAMVESLDMGEKYQLTGVVQRQPMRPQQGILCQSDLVLDVVKVIQLTSTFTRKRQ